MLDFYLDTVVIYFIIFLAEGLVFRDTFLKSQEKINNALNIKKEEMEFLQTTMMYLLISCIPGIRLIALVSKIIYTFYPEKVIEALKKEEKNEQSDTRR